MTGLEILSGAANGLFVLFCVVVGARLLLLARRTRALPELLIGFAFTVCLVIILQGPWLW
jgi:hypothetical protein